MTQATETILPGQLLLGRTISITPPTTAEDELAVVKANRAVNCRMGFPSIPRSRLARDARVAIVGFGPSLADTWGALRGFGTIWTTSKAHDFLLARGITPTFHTDVDFHAHKHTFIARFQPDVEYWLASQVDPEYLRRARADGALVRLFHSQMPNGGPYEPGYVKVEAQFDAGLQAAELAYLMGYRDQHWFGIDASMRGATTHAGPHEGFLALADKHPVSVGGVVYDSNGLLVRAACFAEKQLRARPKQRVTIHGNGMLRPFLQERGLVRVQ